MKRSKLMTGMVLAIFLLTSCFSAFALSFPDVSGTNWSWAEEAISTMSDSGIILGYPEGNFGPGDNVTKVQSLLLISRILGYNTDGNEEVADIAYQKYENVLAMYGTGYKKEIAYLLYRGILSESELNTYIGSTTENAALLRYEAAILLTKAAGKEKEVNNQVISSVLPFDDTTDIPKEARKYVGFVYDNGYMQGMSDKIFSPNTNVNRAQMATMLYRIYNNLKVSIKDGIVSSVADGKLTITSDNGSMSVDVSNIPLRLQGQDTVLEQIPVGKSCTILCFGETPVAVDVYTIAGLETISGVVTKKDNIGGNRIVVQPEGQSSIVSISVPNEAVITMGGNNILFTQIEVGDNVKVTARNNVASTIEVTVRSSSITGATINEVVTDPALALSITTAAGEIRQYELPDSARIYKNGKTATARDLMPGDTVSLTLEYNKIKEVRATSKTKTFEGTIEEINLSANPYIVVKLEDGTTKKVYFSREVEIILDDTEATMYDLRVGYYITFTTESDTVTKIQSKSVSTSFQVTGTVDSVNDNYGFINMIKDNGEKVQIFVKKNAKIYESASNVTRQLGSLKKGELIMAIGSESNGVFEATTVLVITN